MLHSVAVFAVRGMSSVAKSLVVFVLGGPGAGKGTQCARIVKVCTCPKFVFNWPGQPPPICSYAWCHILVPKWCKMFDVLYTRMRHSGTLNL